MSDIMSNDPIAKMQSDLVRLKAEKSRIESSIEEIETALKVLAKYSSIESPVIINATPGFLKLQRQPSKQEQIFQGVITILSDGKPRHTEVLLNELTAQGIEVGGDIPIANLSSYLSRAKERLGLNSDRRNGWSINKNPTDVRASAGSNEVNSLI